MTIKYCVFNQGALLRLEADNLPLYRKFKFADPEDYADHARAQEYAETIRKNHHVLFIETVVTSTVHRGQWVKLLVNDQLRYCWIVYGDLEELR